MIVYRTDLAQGSSPRWRGAPGAAGTGLRRRGLIPALAGSTNVSQSADHMSWAHPRVGGEHDRPERWPVMGVGSSPRWRGAHGRVDDEGPPGGLIPALAGSTRTGSGGRRNCRAHPRVGGEHPAPVWVRSQVRGSSPRWRGAPSQDGAGHSDGGLIPALAGSTAALVHRRGGGRAHPRVGGEHDTFSAVLNGTMGSSPRWRGAPYGSVHALGYGGLIPALAGSTAPTMQDASVELGLIPALAGSTTWSWMPRTRLGAHPRVGGEHKVLWQWCTWSEGSSPRWRGALGRPRAQVRAVGLIPALAGSTRWSPRPRPRTRAHPRVGGEH